MKKEAFDILYNNEGNHWWFCARQEIVFSLLKEQISDFSGKKLLDAGCGTGKTLEGLKTLGCSDLLGIDSSTDAIDYCNQKSINASNASLLELPFEEGTFDLVLAMDVIEHIKDDKKALAEAFRVIKKGGLLLLTVPAFDFLWSEHDILSQHVRRYRKPALETLVKDSGFKIIKSSYYNTLLFPLAYFRKFMTSQENEDLLEVPSPSINKLFYGIFRSESSLLKHVNLPFGVSIINLAIKP